MWLILLMAWIILIVESSLSAYEEDAFSEFKDIRYDKDIMKSYLQGRLGGIPKILLDKTLLDSECNKGET